MDASLEDVTSTIRRVHAAIVTNLPAIGPRPAIGPGAAALFALRVDPLARG
jgi:hypothetical protein